MALARSVNLCERVSAASEADASCRKVAARFGVRVASPFRWAAGFRGWGRIAARLLNGDWHSHRVEVHAALILQADEARPQIYLREVKDLLDKNGATASLSGLSRLLRHYGAIRAFRGYSHS